MYRENSGIRLIRAIAVGAAVGIFICSIILILLSFIFLKAERLPTNAAYIILQIAGAFSAFAGSYTAVRIYKEKGLIVGILTSLLIFIIIFITGLLNCTDNVSVMSLTKLIAVLCAGALGGIVSVNKRKRISRYK